jgi:hypothetical protein
LLHPKYTPKTFAQIQSNTVGKWNLYHCISDETLVTVASLTEQVTGALYSVSIDAANNSASYVTFDVLNPVTASFDNYLHSAHINVANKMTLSVADSIGTLNMAKNDNYVNTAYYVDVSASSAHSVGATNICPRFVLVRHTINLLNVYLNDNLATANSALTKLNADSVNFTNAVSMSRSTSQFYIGACNFGHLNCEQLASNRLALTSNAINQCSITNGYLTATKNTYIRLNLNVYYANLLSCEARALGGTASSLTLSSNTLTLGGFYYKNSTGASNTINRLNTGITV